ncbi:MAG TPA: NADH-quinone oxidoreductase subunit C [Pirellulaceae bacterium]|nr:NADH-quinone oxidoreductase subunit C [Pirellulaceae bacterium]
MPTRPAVITALQEKFTGVTTSEFRGQTRVVIAAAEAFAALSYLKQQQGYDLLVDITCVDYLNAREATDRFGLAYLLTNVAENDRLTVRVFLNEPELTIPSVYPLWEGADWLEREVYDMFGIVFAGHPDLRRILMPDEFVAYPLRKDYPLRGRGERHNFPVLRRNQA